MNKYLRGKRYIRSRESVKVGRINKQIRKLGRLVRHMKTLAEIMEVPNFFDGMIEAMEKMGSAFENIKHIYTPPSHIYFVREDEGK
jgi:hypothetical protein